MSIVRLRRVMRTVQAFKALNAAERSEFFALIAENGPDPFPPRPYEDRP